MKLRRITKTELKLNEDENYALGIAASVLSKIADKGDCCGDIVNIARDMNTNIDKVFGEITLLTTSAVVNAIASFLWAIISQSQKER